MSKILKELDDVVKTSKKKGESDQDYMRRLVRGVSDLEDSDWESLSEDTKNWFNVAADCMNSKKPITPPDDVEETESKEPPPSEIAGQYLKKGDKVKVVTRRDREFEGVVTEVDGDTIYLDQKGEEVEYTISRLKSIEVLKSVGRRSAEKPTAAEAPAVAEPSVGDLVKAVTKRGKEVEGEVIEIEEGTVVIKEGDDEVEVDVEKLQSLVITKAKKSARRSADADAAPPPEEKKVAKVTAKDNGGVSATQVMRELIVTNIDQPKEEIIKLLEKKGVVFKVSTLDLVYADTHKVLSLLKEHKLLK